MRRTERPASNLWACPVRPSRQVRAAEPEPRCPLPIRLPSARGPSSSASSSRACPTPTTKPISRSSAGSSTRSGSTSSRRSAQKRDALSAAAVLGEGKLKELARLTGGKGVVPSGAKEVKTKARASAQWSSHGAGEAHDEAASEDEDDASDGGTPKDGRATRVIVDHEITPEPGAQPGTRDRRRGARSHRRHRGHLPSSRAEPRGAPPGGDRPAQLRRAAPAGGGRQGAAARQGRRRSGDRARIGGRSATESRSSASSSRRSRRSRRPAGRRGAISCAWPSSATRTPASRR